MINLGWETGEVPALPLWNLHLWESSAGMLVKWTVSLTKVIHNTQKDKICSERKELKAFDAHGRLPELTL